MVECISVFCNSCILGIFVVLVINGVFVNTSAEKEIPVTKVGFVGTNVGPSLKFLYCYSCGYRKVFDDYTTILQQRYPDISIQGGNYDPPGYSMYLAKTLGIGKFIIVMCILCGANVAGFLFGQNQNPPSWWLWCTENKLFSCMMILLLSNAIEGHLVSTGAFEISLNDMPVWSKLETGRIPQPPELFQIIDNHMQFDDKTIDIKQMS